MLSELLESRAIWLYRPVLDFRKQVNGLVSIIEGMGIRPNDGAIYIFRNRQRDKLKLLFWDRNGFILAYKRLEKGRFDVGVDPDGHIEISLEQLKMLVSGMPILHLGKGREKDVIFS